MMDTPSTRKTGEENDTVNTDQSNCLQTHRRPKNFRKTSSNYIVSLPVDVLFDILVRVPAQDVHNSTRLVCRKWYKITQTRDFKNAHLHQSTFGLVAHHTGIIARHQHMTFIAYGSKADDAIEISRLSQHRVVLSSCNGLVLASNDIPHYFYITNPVTEQKLDLPPFYSNKVIACGCVIAYVATTMEYKGVFAYIRHPESQDSCVSILTVGVDKDWTRGVNTQHLSLQAMEHLFLEKPLTTQGFVHWALDESKVTWADYERQYGHVLTLNVETEIITQFPVPSSHSGNDNIGVHTEVKYLPMGSYLSLLILRSEFSWELWEMKPETGEWTEMPSIDLHEAGFANSLRNYVLKPVGWLRNREVLVFSAGERIKPSRFYCNNRPTRFCFAFTFRTRRLQKFKLDDYTSKFLVHRNSLVWINGC